MQKIYLNNNVRQESIKRIEYLFDEFENIVIGFSGGKDSTVCLNLSLEVARRKNRLPLKVLFLDQEAEWSSVIDYMKNVMYSEEVEPLWFQIPFVESSGASKSGWFNIWEEKEGVEWIRPKDPISIKENTFGTTSFGTLFTNILKDYYPDKKTCYISGLRADESPARAMAVTEVATYKHITYGKVLDKGREHYTFYPVYDWSDKDIWKAIHDGSWEYCKIYDTMYQHGIPIRQMRVSSLQHETAIHSLFYLQEAEPETWNNVVRRLDGVNTFSKLDKSHFFFPKELPPMFEDWKEYRNHLLENLIEQEDVKIRYKKAFKRIDEVYTGKLINLDLCKTAIGSILVNDHTLVKIGNKKKDAQVGKWLQWKRGKCGYNSKNKYIVDSVLNGEIYE